MDYSTVIVHKSTCFLFVAILLACGWVNGQYDYPDYGVGPPNWNRRCPQLNAPFNGYIQGVCGPGASPGSRCVYRCYNGYQASGQRVLTCQQGGYWDTSPPTCVSNNPPPNTQITCPPLRPPTYGYMTGSCTPGFASLGCTFTCQDGFKLYGSATVVCGYDGRWAGTMPYCQPPVGFIVVRPGRG
ncbi:E-selectin-like isoform X2 [Brevipalpus obovatus]|uniref:E-selectin-like isoform X2 n=1 Tax=Brevipalpus obovatus TaxID=246614 RepID=UPI003D9E29BA